MAERERQELTMELGRQVEENKRLRKSLLAQSAKFLTLRHTASISNPISSTTNDVRHTPVRIKVSLYFLKTHPIVFTLGVSTPTIIYC